MAQNYGILWNSNVNLVLKLLYFCHLIDISPFPQSTAFKTSTFTANILMYRYIIPIFEGIYILH